MRDVCTGLCSRNPRSRAVCSRLVAADRSIFGAARTAATVTPPRQVPSSASFLTVSTVCRTVLKPSWLGLRWLRVVVRGAGLAGCGGL